MPGDECVGRTPDLGLQCAQLTAEIGFENAARHRSAKGEYRWLLIRGVPLRDEHGKILKCTAS
jgi:hypothetical protein